MNALSESDLQNRIDAGLWQLNMSAGDFEQAWQASDRIHARNTPDPHRFWTGESIEGKDIVVRSLRGLGDAVQMFRYAPQLRAQARSVTWQVPPSLVELAGCFEGVEHVVTWEETCTWDMQVEITELPYLFRTTVAQLPIATGYLSVPFGLVDKHKPRIGLVWAAGEWNQSRSIPLAAFDSILSTVDCDFVSLQGGSNQETDDRLETIGPGLLSLASVIADLDLVITVDTLAAHLAGALNVPAYMLLKHAADWRWMIGRDQSPWYPSLRLFRQPQPGDWIAPLEAVRHALGTLKP
ncbi:glycosyltransferase family protein [Granulicella arctica]|uniref:hypothetical protein n=1 Tax=Granulicella arctica TaxID=940613 RepID=UPI0021E06A09|nr:hypothetical protein [Granulicella arctica]